MPGAASRADTQYLGREAALILLWAYVILLAGTFTGMLSFPLRAASALLATLIFGGWLLWRWLQKARLPRSGIEIALIVFLLSQALALAFSEDPRRSLPHALLWLTYALIFYFALDLLRRRWPAELVEKCLLIVGALVLAFAAFELFQSFTVWRQLTVGLEYFPGFKQRLFSVFGDANLLAAFINLLFPLILARALVTQNRASRALLVAYIFVSLFVLYFTGSRGGLLGLSAALGALAVAWVLIVSKTAQKRVRKLWSALLLRRTLLFGAALMLVAIAAFLVWRTLGFQGDATHAATLDARDIYWQAAREAFLTDPLTGVGPGLYPTHLMRIWSTPPARPFLHAHNTIFQIAAESGLVGLAGLGFLLAALVRISWTKWQKPALSKANGLEFADRARWAAVAASLIGFAAHSLVDDFLPFVSAGAVAAVMLAILLAPAAKTKKQSGFSPLWLLIPAALTAALSINPLRAYARANVAVDQGGQGDWRAAAEGMLAAAELDPSFALYWLQSGYAYGRASQHEPEFLDEAIAAYEHGIDLEPIYGLSRANLGALYYQSGNTGQAIDQLSLATDLASNSWLFWLNRGIYAEQVDHDAAREAYLTALELKPEIADSSYWAISDLQREVNNSFDPPVNVAESNLDQAIALVETARDLIQNDRFARADGFLRQAWELNDQEVQLYIALAELSISEGNLTLADQYSQLAIWVQSPSNESKVEAILLRAEIVLTWDDKQTGIILYRQAYDAYLVDNSYGWGSYGWTPYAWFVFQRRAFPEDLLPQLVRADILPDIARRLLTLADLYEEQGEAAEAQKIRDSLQPYLP